jgi:hypothetical protein
LISLLWDRPAVRGEFFPNNSRSSKLKLATIANGKRYEQTEEDLFRVRKEEDFLFNFGLYAMRMQNANPFPLFQHFPSFPRKSTKYLQHIAY